MSQKNIWRPVGCLLIALAIALTNAPLHTSAATSGGNGQRVSPVRTDVTIYPGKSETVTVNITNVTTKPA